MFELRQNTSIFDVGANVIVNPVNCVGVMGKGLAEVFKSKYPENYKLYRAYCNTGHMVVGKVFVTCNSDVNGLTIINFPTKKHWRHPSLKSYIHAGLLDVRECLQPGDIVAMPLLGCGCGELPSGVVFPMIRDLLRNLPGVQIILCATGVNQIAELL